MSVKDLVTAQLIESLSQKYYYKFPGISGLTDRSVLLGGERVSLSKLTCSCQEYRMRRKRYHDDDIRLFCIHLFNHAVQDYHGYIDKLSRLILDSGFWLDQKFIISSEDNISRLIFGFNGKLSKMFVYTFLDRWRMFQFNVTENKFSGIKPCHADEYILRIQNFLIRESNY